MCVTSLCTRAALDTWSRGRRTAALGGIMWPFKKKRAKLVDTKSISVSQLDITERFGDNLRLTEQDWIQTIPLNERAEDPQSMGLPPRDASPDTVYAIADRLSRFRESIELPSDGVY